MIDNELVVYKEKIKKFYSFTKECNGTRICPVRDIMAPSVDKWSLFVIYNLAYNKVLRFSKLKSYIPGISSRMLSVTLKRLENSHIIQRKVYPEVPPKVEYRLTEFGHEFSHKLIDLNLWVMDNFPMDE